MKWCALEIKGFGDVTTKLSVLFSHKHSGYSFQMDERDYRSVSQADLLEHKPMNFLLGSQDFTPETSGEFSLH